MVDPSPLTPPPPGPPTQTPPPSSTAPIPVAFGPELGPVAAPAPAAPNVPAVPGPGDATVPITIDGETVVVRRGTNILEAIKSTGEEICYFCYHPGLTVAASCRQCLVDVEVRGRSMGKLQPACQIEVADEMVVRTKSPAVHKARREMLEFTLKNHPIDCPICDKAGECTLQRHYMAHDHNLTRVDVPKIRKPKVKDIGREIVLDAERCILCSRCVRFCEEIPKTAELGMVNRGDHEEIDVANGARLDNAYSMNVIDICPVGALTAKDFRFAIRTWELRETPTTCPGCATGCAVELHSKHERAYRVIPRLDPSVNGHWMCDEGRYTYKALDPELRLLQAQVSGKSSPLATAIAEAAAGLKGKKVAAVFSATATNEANAALASLADLVGAERYLLGRAEGKGDALLRDADKNPNLRGAYAAAGLQARHEGELALGLAGRAFQAVILLDCDAELSDVALRGLSEIHSVVLTDRRGPLSDACRVALPCASWAESLGTVTNRQGRLRVFQPAWRAEGDRQHAADHLRALVLALGGQDIGPSRAQTQRIAETHQDEALLALLREHEPPRPTLLRFGNSRG